MESSYMYILIYPNDESGNDDGVLDRREMTESRAEELNERFRNEQQSRRWVKER